MGDAREVDGVHGGAGVDGGAHLGGGGDELVPCERARAVGVDAAEGAANLVRGWGGGEGILCERVCVLF